MLVDLFNRCIEVVLKNEGGYVNHLSDPGGETNMGITKREYPQLDIKNLTKNQAVEIYYDDYWLRMNLTGVLNESLILHIFDMGVNAGIRTAIKMVQRLVNTRVDGYVGDDTTNKINSYDGDLLGLYIQKRKSYYTSLVTRKPELKVFLKGWLNRVNNTHL